MTIDDKVLETRPITSEEAEACANEQVQFIGSIQPHGFLLVVEPISQKIVQYSENLITLLNHDLATPLESDTLVLNSELSDWLDFDSDAFFKELVVGANQTLRYGTDGRISSKQWECLGVLIGEYACLEFFPTTHKQDSYSLLSRLDRMVTRIRATKTLDELFRTVTKEFQKHTNYDRVMLYKFLPDWSGEVVAEAVSDRTEVKFLGLRFPAEDIPKKARELYENSSLRVIADVGAQPVALIPPLLPNGKPLDQSVSVLRSMSVMHVAYLKNMGINASMSIALMSSGKLWGLMAFHHYTPKVPPNHLVSEMKASCELFAEIIISHLHPKLDLEAVQRAVDRRKMIEKAFGRLKNLGDEFDFLQIALNDIQYSMGKAYIGICLEGDCYTVSENGSWTPEKSFALRLNKLISQAESNFYQSNQLLDNSFPIDQPLDAEIAGIIVLKSKNVPELSVFFGAREVEQEVTWGGKPGTVNIVVKNGERLLEPRSSFALWRQKVTGHSKPWSEEDKKLLEELLTAVEGFVLYSKSERVKAKLHHTSYNDALTGLPNRRYLEDFIQNLTVHTERVAYISIFFLDLDNFKRINDFMGHHAGDRLLIEVAKRLKRCVRPDDLVARLGGDEFVVVMLHDSDDVDLNKVSAQRVARKIMAAIGQPVFDGERPMVTTPSVGAVMCDPNKVGYGEILKRADIAMYRAKNAGKNQVYFFSAGDQWEVNREGHLELGLRQCLSDKKLQVFFQPQVNSEHEIIGAEVLARWIHPELGIISPDVFIPLAEKNNLIFELGTQIFDMACSQLAKWQQTDITANFKKLSVNISPAQLLNKGFEEKIRSIVKRHNLNMHSIRLEITEAVFIQNFDDAKKILQSLRDSGITVSLDDFGKGYSSLSYLWKLPIDEVKIDRSFVASMNDDENSLTMVESIISLCKKLNLEIVAEGVEEKVQVSLLRGMGCDIYQGYYFGKPVNAEQFSFKVA